MLIDKKYFEIEYDLAKKISEMTRMPLEDALLTYTMFFRRLFIPGKQDPNNPEWMIYINRIRDGEDPLDAFYELHSEKQRVADEKIAKGETEDRPFGAFKYEITDGAVWIHFSPIVGVHDNSLKKENMNIRLAELTKMFAEIKEKYPEVKTVNGNTWIYNLEAYRRLFPPEYTRDFTITTDCFQGSSAWGQFLHADGSINIERVEEFYKNLEDLDPQNPHEVFPFQVRRVSVPITYFYDFYRV